MLRFNFDELFDSHEAEIQIYIGDQLLQSDRLQAPSMILKQNYIQLLQSIIQESQPMSVKMLIKHDVYDENEKYVRTLWNSVECSNYERKYED